MEKIRGIDLAEVGHKKVMMGILLGDENENYILTFPKEEMIDNPSNIHFELNLSKEEWERLLQQMDTLQVEVTNGKDLAKTILRKSQRNIEQSVSWEVYRRDHFTCRYCGDNTSPMTVDHVITWESMGPSIVKNLVCSCKKCNRVRGNTSYEDWLNSDYYKKVSERLPEDVKKLNLSLVDTLKSIPLRTNMRSR